MHASASPHCPVLPVPTGPPPHCPPLHSPWTLPYALFVVASIICGVAFSFSVNNLPKEMIGAFLTAISSNIFSMTSCTTCANRLVQTKTDKPFNVNPPSTAAATLDAEQGACLQCSGNMVIFIIFWTFCLSFFCFCAMRGRSRGPVLAKVPLDWSVKCLVEKANPEGFNSETHHLAIQNYVYEPLLADALSGALHAHNHRLDVHNRRPNLNINLGVNRGPDIQAGFHGGKPPQGGSSNPLSVIAV